MHCVAFLRAKYFYFPFLSQIYIRELVQRAEKSSKSWKVSFFCFCFLSAAWTCSGGRSQDVFLVNIKACKCVSVSTCVYACARVSVCLSGNDHASHINDPERHALLLDEMESVL